MQLTENLFILSAYLPRQLSSHPNCFIFVAQAHLGERTKTESILQNLRSLIVHPRLLLLAYMLLALIASIQQLLLPPHIFSGIPYTEYNNYVIFKQSWYHLLAGKNMYILYPELQWDLYKYSPTFALFMGLLSRLPDFIGLTIWNLSNSLILYVAIRMLPFKDRTISLLLWFVSLELLTSIQNAQSNGIMTGLLIGAYASMQRGKIAWATLWLVIATFIKVYGAIGFCLFLFYPDKIKFLAWAAIWTILTAILPLAVTPYPTLVWQYHNWASMMAADQSASYGLSVIGWLHSWFGISSGKSIISIIGILLFLIPFIRFRLYRNEVYKLMMVASMLIWVIIFNHKAESPTFIIAVAGVGIWYFSRPRQLWRSILIAIVFIFTCLSPTDLFPPWLRDHFFIPYTIKAVPCILLWCVVFYELMTIKKDAHIPANVLPG